MNDINVAIRFISANIKEFVYAKIMQGECRTSNLFERYAEPQLIFCKDSQNK